MLAAGPNGVVYGLTRERLRPAEAGQPRATKQRVFLSKSTDGGQSWATTVAFDDVKGLSDPGVAVDPRNGNVYVVFENGVASGTEHVLFIASSDQGKTWSKPVDIIDDPDKGHNKSVPGISVAPDGRVDVAWYDFRNAPFFVAGGTVEQRYADVYSASSNDGGRSWSKNIRVSDRSIDTNIGATFDNENVRSQMGIASTKDAALIAWSDSRAGALPSSMSKTRISHVPILHGGCRGPGLRIPREVSASRVGCCPRSGRIGATAGELDEAQLDRRVSREATPPLSETLRTHIVKRAENRAVHARRTKRGRLQSSH